jgi:peptide/nickel transport system substrate-binding protein
MEAMGTNFIPYEPTMSEFVTKEEAADRYERLVNFNHKYGHFWEGTGPFVLKAVHPVEGNLELERYDAYPDSANKWSRFAEPKIAEVEVDGPGRVKIGDEATFDVMVTFNGDPYPADEIDEVKYLVFDSNGDLAATGSAEAVEDGKYKVVLGADVTGKLEAGSDRIEIAVTSKVVSIPSFASMEFVTVP